MIVRIHPHARQRLRERGANTAQVRQTIENGRVIPAKFGRTQFSHVFAFNATWNGKHYSSKLLDVFAAKIPGGWMVVTVIVKYF